MTPPRGAPRKLSDDQIKTILAWHDARRQFQQRQGTLAALARRLGVSTYAISWCIGRKKSGQSWASRRVRLSPRQRRQIHSWRRRREAFRQRQGTVEDLARRLGVHRRTVQQCIRRLGRYRQVTAAELPVERQRTKSRRKSASTSTTGDWRVSLLREWLSSAPIFEERGSCSIGTKPFDVKEADLPARAGSLGCACVWFLIQSVESRGITVAGATERCEPARWLIPYAQISLLLPADALHRRIRTGRARVSRDGGAALMRPVFGF
jgi:transposase